MFWVKGIKYYSAGCYRNLLQQKLVTIYIDLPIDLKYVWLFLSLIK